MSLGVCGGQDAGSSSGLFTGKDMRSRGIGSQQSAVLI